MKRLSIVNSGKGGVRCQEQIICTKRKEKDNQTGSARMRGREACYHCKTGCWAREGGREGEG